MFERGWAARGHRFNAIYGIGERGGYHKRIGNTLALVWPIGDVSRCGVLA